jgi:hypothetical protein
VSRIHGRNGIVYVGLTNGAAASPIAFQSDYTINFTVAKVDVTSMGDTNLVYVSGLPDASGDFNGWYDDLNGTAQTYAAAADGLSRNFYLYPNSNSPTEYFYGQVLPDFAVAGAVSAGVSVKATWNAAGPVKRMRAGVVG